MRSIFKVFFLSLFVFLLSFLPFLAGQPESEIDLKEPSARVGVELDSTQIRLGGGELRPYASSQSNSESGIMEFRGAKRDLITRRGFDPNQYLYTEPFDFAKGKHDNLIDSIGKRVNFPIHNSNGTSLNPQEQKVIKAIIDDFLVNEDTVGGCKQSSPAIVRDTAGNFVITWADERNGHFDIYAQRYHYYGYSLGLNFMVNDDAGDAYQGSPAIAMDIFGNFVITWEDFRKGVNKADIYAQRYDFSGIPLGSNFKVNDDTGSVYRSFPAIATDFFGNFTITWADRRNGDWDIYAQRYNSLGTPLDSNFKVNDDVSGTAQFLPVIGMHLSGMCVITWVDERNEHWYKKDIYAQRYSSTGAPLGPNFMVNDVAATADQGYPAIAMGGYGKFIITWEDYRNGNSNIYAQRYNSSAIPLGSNFKVNDDTGTASHSSPAVAMDIDTNFIIIWEDYRKGWDNLDIYAQGYNSSGFPLGSNFKVNDDDGTENQISPAIAKDGSGNYIIAWEDYRNGNSDIYAQRYIPYRISIGSNFKVNDDTESADQNTPAIAMDSSDDFVVVWEDYRNGNSDIYTQRYNSSGIPVYSNFKVNDDTVSSGQVHPAIAMNGSGNFAITWEDTRNGYYDIYAQRYDSSGTRLDSNFKVAGGSSGDWSATYTFSPAVAMDGCGHFVITWQWDWIEWMGNPEVDYGINAQIFNSLGIRVGSILNVIWYYWRETHAPAIAMDGSGKFVITWFEGNSWPTYHYDIFTRRYDSSGTALSSDFRVNDDAGSANQYYPAIAMADSGNFIITWEDYLNGNWDIYAQKYDSAGVPVGSNFKVNDDVGSASQWYPDIASDGSGNFVIAWQDNRNGNWDIYAQRYDSTGNPLGSNYMVNNSQSASFTQGYPTVAANSSYICFTWQDNRRGKGWDIYAKVVDWNWSGTGVEEEQEANLPNSFELLQNYPNPFNPATAIPFTVYSKQKTVNSPIHTTLSIYNILGQKVKTLVDEDKLPGEYKVVWDGKDNSGEEMASGIYFYQLKTKDFTKTKKMVLLR